LSGGSSRVVTRGVSGVLQKAQNKPLNGTAYRRPLAATMSRRASASAHRAAAVPIRFWAALARAPSAAGAHAVPSR
jgi:hypothetical protein